MGGNISATVRRHRAVVISPDGATTTAAAGASSWSTMGPVRLSIHQPCETPPCHPRTPRHRRHALARSGSGQRLPLLNPSDGSTLARDRTRQRRGRGRRQQAGAGGARGRVGWPASPPPSAAGCRWPWGARCWSVDELARLEALDVGKPLKRGRADAAALARYLEFYGGAGDKVSGETILNLPERLHRAHLARAAWRDRRHVVPWNYPMQIIGCSVGAALAMGNACVLEARRGSLPDGAYVRPHRAANRPAGRRVNIDAGPGRRSRRAYGACRRRHLSFTGSVATGRLGRRRLRSTPCR